MFVNTPEDVGHRCSGKEALFVASWGWQVSHSMMSRSGTDFSVPVGDSLDILLWTWCFADVSGILASQHMSAIPHCV